MDEDLLSTLISLKCHFCENILSVPPIFTISSEENQCGRCKHVKHEKAAIRNTIFESVAKYLKFPCTNAGCTTMLPWNDVENHEIDCSNATITCPMFHEDCQDKISMQKVTEHMMRKHSNSIFFEKIELTVPMFKSFVCVAVVDSIEYLIYICMNKVVVTSVKSNMNNLNYLLKLTRIGQNIGQSTPTLLYEDQTIETFVERKHCFRCLERCCHLKQHPFSAFHSPDPKFNQLSNNEKTCKNRKKENFSSFASANGSSTNYGNTFGFFPNNGSGFSTSNNSFSFGAPVQNDGNNSMKIVPNNTELGNEQKFNSNPCQLREIKFTSFNLASVQSLLGISPSLLFTFKISSQEEPRQEGSLSSDSFIPRNLLHTIDNTRILRNTLECPICNELMAGKIFLCEWGHQICEECKTSNVRSTCPFCSGVFANCRSSALETLAEECSLCCSSIGEGCEFRGNVGSIVKHEAICAFIKK